VITLVLSLEPPCEIEAAGGDHSALPESLAVADDALSLSLRPLKFRRRRV
jgi:hypothetical protein